MAMRAANLKEEPDVTKVRGFREWEFRPALDGTRYRKLEFSLAATCSFWIGAEKVPDCHNSGLRKDDRIKKEGARGGEHDDNNEEDWEYWVDEEEGEGIEEEGEHNKANEKGYDGEEEKEEGEEDTTTMKETTKKEKTTTTTTKKKGEEAPATKKQQTTKK
ncbi:MAG: hypothetical protein M1815_002799 [Lichina confinis]|nr:MAG: hypothetical protein M1815_002799 [Lichina confinis]